jgi:RNA polymerase sigma-70 factor (ECF subfamily)
MDEKQWINNIKNGDIKSFESFFRQFYQPLCEYASSLVKDYDLSEELVQDVFFQIWKKRADIKIQTTLQGYLYQSVKNECLQHIRHKAVEKKYAEKVQKDFNHTEYFPTDELVVNEISDKINSTLESLPDKCKEIFKLSRFEGLKYSEIAEKLSVSVKTVESYMGKALKIFRENLSIYIEKIPN